MFSRLRFPLLLPLAALLGCGSTSNSPGGTNFAATSGDYVFTVGAGTATAAIFSGNLAVSGSSVSGVLRYNVGSQCVLASQDIAVNGTDASGLVTLTSAAFAGGVATLTLQLPLVSVSGGQQIANGTAVITGGTCARPSTTLQAQLIPSFAGNWTGTVSGNGTGTASVQITQSGPNSDGQFPASASVSFSSSTNASCSFNTTASAPATGLVSGATIQLANANGTITVFADASSKPVNFSIGFGGNGTAPGTCFGSYSGALSN